MKFDAVRFCEDNDVQYWTEANNLSAGWIGVTCPFCDDSSSHGAFNIDSGAYHCWKCGSHSLWDVVKTLTGVSNPKQVLRAYGIIRSNSLPKNEEKKIDFVLPGGSPLKKKHKKYLENRGFDADYIETKYQLRGTDNLGKYKFRLVIPVLHNHRVVSFTTRDISGQVADDDRYRSCHRNMEIIQHKHVLYNGDNCFKDRALAVEGPFDAMKVGDNCFATFGTSFTMYQIKQMRRFKTIFFMFDPEENAYNKALKGLVQLNSMGISTEILTLDHGDPAEMSEDDVVYLKKDLKLY